MNLWLNLEFYMPIKNYDFDIWYHFEDFSELQNIVFTWIHRFLVFHRDLIFTGYSLKLYPVRGYLHRPDHRYLHKVIDGLIGCPRLHQEGIFCFALCLLD